VQIRPGHSVLYDASSDDVIRMIHVGGTLTFARNHSTKLNVGLIKVQPGDTATEDGFACDAHAMPDIAAGSPAAALEIGTLESPIPAGVTATIRLAYVEGADKETVPRSSSVAADGTLTARRSAAPG